MLVVMTAENNFHQRDGTMILPMQVMDAQLAQQRALPSRQAVFCAPARSVQ